MSKSHVVFALFLVLLAALPFSHSARLLNDFPLPATHLSLPTDQLRPSPDNKVSGAIPCDVGRHSKHPGLHRLGGKYRPLYLGQVLPKGTTPPSGPSKGTNDVNN